MAVVHIYKLGDDGLPLCSSRTMKGLPRDVGSVDSWWKACRRTFRGTKWEHVFEHIPMASRVSDSDLRFRSSCGNYAIIVDRQTEILTS